MFCIRCGTSVIEGAAYCVGCGARVPHTDAQEPQEPARAIPDPPNVGRAAMRWSEATNRPFRFAGVWWTRDLGGRVGRWDETRGRWVAPDHYETPFFMRRPAFTSLRGPAIWLYITLGIFIVVTLISLVASVDMIRTLDRIAGGERVSFADWDASWDFFWGWQILASSTLLLVAPFFIWWTRRATCNVTALGAAEPTFSPGWAVAWWFIPFAAMVQPLRVLNQAWRASDPGLPLFENLEWRKVRLTALLPLWWVTYQVAGVLWSLALRFWDPAMDAGSLRNLTIFILLTQMAMGAVAVVTIGVVALLTGRQEEANRRFDIPDGALSITGEEQPFAPPEAVLERSA